MIEDFINIRFKPECQILDENILDEINTIFKSSCKKTKNVKKNSNFKNNFTFNLKKNKNENKFIFILNKISNNNINELCIEYIENINITSIEEYNVMIEIIFFKMLKDIILCESYIKFFINIIKINKLKFSLDCNYFNTLCHNWVSYFYKNKSFEKTIEEKFTEYDNEIYRFNFLELINLLVKNNFYNIDIKDNISNVLLKQNKYITDIHYWFKNNDKEEYMIELKNIETNNIREKLLIESLFETKLENEKELNIIPSDVKNTENDMFKTQVTNIIEEYKYLKMSNEVTYFVNNECIDIDSKIRFSEILLSDYLINKDDDILKLIEYLLNKKVLFKSNISKALKNVYNNNVINDYILDNFKNILILLKNNNITKNIEFIFNKVNISI
jgi:hypothetical protein